MLRKNNSSRSRRPKKTAGKDKIILQSYSTSTLPRRSSMILNLRKEFPFNLKQDNGDHKHPQDLEAQIDFIKCQITSLKKENCLLTKEAKSVKDLKTELKKIRRENKVLKGGDSLQFVMDNFRSELTKHISLRK